jgi:hypothetical protein
MYSVFLYSELMRDRICNRFFRLIMGLRLIFHLRTGADYSSVYRFILFPKSFIGCECYFDPRPTLNDFTCKAHEVKQERLSRDAEVKVLNRLKHVRISCIKKNTHRQKFPCQFESLSFMVKVVATGAQGQEGEGAKGNSV